MQGRQAQERGREAGEDVRAVSEHLYGVDELATVLKIELEFSRYQPRSLTDVVKAISFLAMQINIGPIHLSFTCLFANEKRSTYNNVGRHGSLGDVKSPCSHCQALPRSNKQNGLKMKSSYAIFGLPHAEELKSIGLLNEKP